jgi:hypothetical protein
VVSATTLVVGFFSARRRPGFEVGAETLPTEVP